MEDRGTCPSVGRKRPASVLLEPADRYSLLIVPPIFGEYASFHLRPTLGYELLRIEISLTNRIDEPLIISEERMLKNDYLEILLLCDLLEEQIEVLLQRAAVCVGVRVNDLRSFVGRIASKTSVVTLPMPISCSIRRRSVLVFVVP